MARFGGATLGVGTEFAGYRVEALIGRGGMGVVYRARDLALERTVALKLLAPEIAEDEGFRRRCQREAMIAAAIDHPNVVPIYEAGEADGTLYIAMRFVTGTDLRSLLDAEATLQPQRVVGLASQLAGALDAAHERGLVHRDVKPSNILISGERDREHCYLADFGLTKPKESRTTPAGDGQILGTPGYLAPEQIVEGVAVPASDRYSLGCVVFECLTGDVPFPRESEFAELWAHVNDSPPKPSTRRPQLPEELDPVLSKALAKDPAKRYESAEEFVNALGAAVPREDGPALGSGRSRRLLAATVAVLAAAVVVLAIVLSGREDSGSSTAPSAAPATGAVQRLDPQSNELVATIPIGGFPVDVATGGGAAWVVDSKEQAVLRIDAATNAVTRGGAGAGSPTAVVVGRGGPIVAGDGPEGVSVGAIDAERVQPMTQSTLAEDAEIIAPELLVRPVSAVSGLAVAGPTRHAVVWIADAAAGTVWRGEVRQTGPIVRAVGGGGMPLAVAIHEGRVWVAQPGEVVQVREGDHAEPHARSTRVRGTPVALAAARDGVWTAIAERGVLVMIDHEGRIARRAVVGGHLIDVALGRGILWALRDDGVLSGLDPRSGRIESRISVGPNPSAVAVGEDAVWVVVRGGEALDLGHLPTRYTFSGGTTEGIEPGRPGSRCTARSRVIDCVVIVSQELVAEDGTNAFRRAAFRDVRTMRARAECRGRLYDDAAISNVNEEAGIARVDVEGWGIAALRTDRRLGVSDGLRANAHDLCTEQSGTWAGTTGALRGATGTFRVDADTGRPLTLTLRPTPTGE